MQVVIRVWLVAAIILFASATPAMAQLVSCPVAEATRSISTPLPPEWRQVPFAQRLTRAHIRESGTLQTLICEYGQAGTIERDGPRDARCTVRGTSAFYCVGAPVARLPGVVLGPQAVLAYRTGTVTLRSDAGARATIDLDGGSTTGPSHLNDLEFFVNARGEWEMAETSAVRVWMHNGTTPMHAAGCMAERETRYTRTYSARAPAVGRYMCYITNGGRVGELQTTAVGTTPGGSPTITLAFQTWP